MSQKPLPKIYDRPERKFLSPALLAMAIVLLVIVAGFLTYYLTTHRAAAIDNPVSVASPAAASTTPDPASPMTPAKTDTRGEAR